MPPHLHPRSRSTLSLFAATLGASFIVVGLPHLFPCPAPRRTLADSSDMMITTVDSQGQRAQRIGRKRRKDCHDASERRSASPRPADAQTQTAAAATEDEVLTFLQLEQEAQELAKVGRECPVPKPGVILGEWLGFKKVGEGRRQQIQQCRGSDAIDSVSVSQERS